MLVFCMRLPECIADLVGYVFCLEGWARMERSDMSKGYE